MCSSSSRNITAACNSWAGAGKQIWCNRRRRSDAGRDRWARTSSNRTDGSHGSNSSTCAHSCRYQAGSCDTCSARGFCTSHRGRGGSCRSARRGWCYSLVHWQASTCAQAAASTAGFGTPAGAAAGALQTCEDLQVCLAALLCCCMHGSFCCRQLSCCGKACCRVGILHELQDRERCSTGWQAVKACWKQHEKQVVVFRRGTVQSSRTHNGDLGCYRQRRGARHVCLHQGLCVVSRCLLRDLCCWAVAHHLPSPCY